VGVYGPPVVESATRYKCGQVQSAQAYVDGHCSQDVSLLTE